MGYSYQRYLVAMDDTLYRMANTAFERVLSEPTRYRVPELAGQRVRTVEVVVEIAGRQPVAVVRQAFAVLAFDAVGSVDVARLRKQQYARIETALAPVFADPSVTRRSSKPASSSLPKAAHGHCRQHWQGPSTTQPWVARTARAWTHAPAAPDSHTFSWFAALATSALGRII